MRVVTITTNTLTLVYDAEDVDIVSELEEIGRPAIIDVEEWTQEEFEAVAVKEREDGLYGTTTKTQP